MPRKPRCHVSGAFYHVTTRGNHQQDIFHNESYYLHLLSLLERNAAKHLVNIHAYALMTNHIHLVVQVGEQPLGDFMQSVLQSYTQYVNTRNQQTGHLFQGRYHATLIDNDEYLLAVVRYIHLNPVTAGLVNDPIEYRWSSHRHYLSGTGEGQVATNFVKDMMEQSGTEIGDYQLLGDNGRIVRAPTALPELVDSIARFTRLSAAEIIGSSRSRDVAAARKLFAYLAGKEGHSIVSIGTYLERAQSGISTTIQEIDQDIQRGGEWADRLREFHKQLKIGV